MTSYDFMFLFKGGMPREKEKDENVKLWSKWMGELIDSGVFVRGEPFQDKGKAVMGYDKKVMDYVPSFTFIGGYLIINTSGLDKAVEIAKGCPIFNNNGEVIVIGMDKL